MSSDEILEVLELKGAILHGHFRLSSGRHSDLFVQKFRVLEDPATARSLGENLARNFDGDFDVVAAPAVGAIVLGFATALAAEARSIFAERSGDAMVFRRGFSLGPEERVLVVEDVVTTGKSTLETVAVAEQAGAVVVAAASIINRGGGDALAVPYVSLADARFPTFAADAVPTALRDVPAVKPGSRPGER